MNGREWMYRRRSGGSLNPEFKAGLEYFITFATSHPNCMDMNSIRCPCVAYDNMRYQEVDVVRYHLAQRGFVKNYKIWRFHGEGSVPTEEYPNHDMAANETYTSYHEMVMDHARTQFHEEETPNPNAQGLFDMLSAADRELWPGCIKHSQLSLVSRLMTLKAENNMSVRCFDQVTKLMKEIVPEEDLIPKNFYETKRLLRDLGLPVEKIDCCPNNCMIYWGDDIDLIQCKFCSTSRFKDTHRGTDGSQGKVVAAKKMYYFPLTPRLQRLYASKATTENMRWHASSPNDGVMRHPADSPAWKHLDDSFPSFAAEHQNVRLGLSTDGFQPFGQSGQQYSSWPIILTPYNLPPWMCMKEQFMFLTVLVPGPRNPKEKIDVFLQPLISELKNLWEVGAVTYDVSCKQNFEMRACLLWTISDFPAYAMLSGWSTVGRLACPRCMEETDAFTLLKSGKQSWFGNHRKFLPPDHAFRRNKKDFIKNKQVLTTGPPEGRSGEELLSHIELKVA